MPRKVALSPLQNRVLWALEEAGEETMATVKATVRADDDEMLEREIAALEQLAFITRSSEDGRLSLVLTSSGRRALTT